MEAEHWQQVRNEPHWSLITATCLNFGCKPLGLLNASDDLKRDLAYRIVLHCWFYGRLFGSLHAWRSADGSDQGDARMAEMTRKVKPVDFVTWRQSMEDFFGPMLPELKELLDGKTGASPVPSAEDRAGEPALPVVGKGRKRPDLRDKWESQRNQILGAAFAILAAFSEDCRDDDGRVNVTKLINQMNSKAGLFLDVGTEGDGSWDLPQHHDTIEKLLREWLAKVR
jgi:hypothetical protein